MGRHTTALTVSVGEEECKRPPLPGLPLQGSRAAPGQIPIISQRFSSDKLQDLQQKKSERVTKKGMIVLSIMFPVADG